MIRLMPLLLVALLTAAGSSPAALAEEEGTRIRTQTLRGPLHLLQGRGGNVVASVGFDGILLIDDDYAELGPAYEEAISALTQSKLMPGFVINTHWHTDHTGNNEFWASRGAVILGHRNVRGRMSTPQKIRSLDMVVEPSPPMALPMVTFADSLALHFNGTDIEVQHYPAGHTDGDSVIYYSQDNVVHMGDLYFKDAFPFIDLSSGGSVAGYIANVQAVLGRVDEQTLIVPGHGAVAGKADLERFLAMLKSTAEAVRGALDKGKSVEEITALTLGAEWASWGQGFINEAAWIATIAADHQQ